jgi:hypothetical protein
MSVERQKQPDGLSPEELEEQQLTELPEREALSVVNLGLPMGSTVANPLPVDDVNAHDTIDPPEQS